MKVDTLQQTQQASALSSLLNCVFVMVVLIAIPLLYHFEYINALWLNRIGIILNFCAGFLVSPELLFRSDLLIKAEQNLKIFISKLQSILDKTQSYINSFLGNFSDKRWGNISSFLLCIMMCLVIYNGFNRAGISFSYFLVPILYLITIPIVLFELFFEYKKGILRNTPLIRYIILVFIFPFIFLVFIFVFPSLFIALWLLGFAGVAAKSVFNRLIGDNRLRSILVWWGVIFFIVGNLLQFISTF